MGRLAVAVERAQDGLVHFEGAGDHEPVGFGDVLLEGGSMKSMMRKANKMGAAYVLVIGEDEQKDGTASVKAMTTGESVPIKQSDVVAHIKKK